MSGTDRHAPGAALSTEFNRRTLLTAGGVMTASLATGVASARIPPARVEPLVGAGYAPTDADEKGMWALMERVEEEVSGSNLLVLDPGLLGYLGNLIGKVGGPAAKDMRIYLARIPEFNAMMFPTGFTVIFTGLLLRMRSEAQLAGVIAHEASHFLLKHQIRSWRDMRRKTDIFAFLAMGAGVAGGAAGVNTGDVTNLARLGTMLSLLQYSRQMEGEADALGIKLLAGAGYDPMEMPRTWAQLIGEQKYSAKIRGKRRRRDWSIFGTHPVPEQRMKDLQVSAAEVRVAGATYADHRARYVEAIAGIRPTLIDDQVKLNDPGASQYVIEQLAQDGWDGPLRHAEAEVWRLRGRPGDAERAAQGYANAVLYPDAPADAWRWHGLMLDKAGRAAEAAEAYRRYLALAPAAPDAPYIRSLLARSEAR